MSKSKKGRMFTPEHRQKISIAKTGQLLSAETKSKISAIKKLQMQGIGNSFFGKHHKQETKDRISNQKGLGWITIHPNGQQTTVISLKRFCEENGLDRTAMGRVANGKAIHHKGWQCRKLNAQDQPSQLLQSPDVYTRRQTTQGILRCIACHVPR